MGAIFHEGEEFGGALSIDTLMDVDGDITPADGDILVYNAAKGLYEPSGNLSSLNSALSDLEIVDLSSKIHTNNNFGVYFLTMKKQGNLYIIDYALYATNAFNAGDARQFLTIDNITLPNGIFPVGLHLNSSQTYKGILRVYTAAATNDIRFVSTAAGAVNDFFEGQIILALNN